MRIPRDKTAALIIDVQERLFPHIQDHDVLVSNMGILIRGLQIMEIPLMVTQQYSKGLGKTIDPVEKLFMPFKPIEKTAFSCCDEPGIMAAMERTGKDFIILAGIESHVCVLQTTLDLLERGFKPVVIEDCISSRKADDKDTAIHRMRQEGAIITSYESILFELCRFSGSPEFKQISSLVK